MRRIRPLAAIVALGVLPLLWSCSGRPADDQGPGEPERLEIAVIPKSTMFTFWNAVHAGAAAAGEEFDADIIWMGPNDENDRRQQIELVQNFISRSVDAIVLAPLDEVALARPVEAAVARGIPVVVIDSDLESEAPSSVVATDNVEGGRMAARRLAEVMGRQGKVILLRFNEGSASNDQREDGFLEELAQNYPQIEILSSNQYAGTTKESAFQASQNLLNKHGDEAGGIFCPNEPVAFGMLRALETSNRAGKIKFVGFDAGESLVKAMREGSIHGLVAQDPRGIGYQGVKTALAVLRGEEVPRRIATRVVTITPENLDTPEIRALISPEVEASQE
jgi:ribose transport system substrate-binding protein